MAYHPFKGKLRIHYAKKCEEFKFNVEPEENTINDVLMCQFEKLKLSADEKKALCANYRKELFQFQNVNVPAMQEYAEQLANLLNNSGETEIEVVAGGLGSYICLATIFSGKLDKKIHIQFTLSSVPLSLFPRKLLKTKKPVKKYDVKFFFKENSWLKSFKSLYTCPKHMKFDHEFVQDKTWERQAA